MKPFGQFGLVVVFSALAAACGGPTVADVVADQISLSVTGFASAPDVAALGDAKGGVGVSRAFFNSSGLRLLSCDHGVEPLDLDPYGYELLQDPPLAEDISTGATDLCAIRFALAPTSKAQGGIAKGTSLYVEGKDADGADFSLTSASEQTLSFAVKSDVGSFGDQPLLLGVDVSVWLDGLDVAPDAPEPPSAFEPRFCEAAALYVDANDNQRLDDDETTSVADCAVYPQQ